MSIDRTFTGVRRLPLDAGSWVDFLPDWVSGADTLFEQLATTGPWQQPEDRVMYDRIVAVPRMHAHWPTVAALPQPLATMRDALSERYHVDFDRVGVNLYRSGADSVAWHGDRNRLTHTNPIVVTVSLGDRRTFALRPRAGGATALSLRLGGGDLLVMLGACQHEWEHCVPKSTLAGARMSITFRHSEQTAAGSLSPV